MDFYPKVLMIEYKKPLVEKNTLRQFLEDCLVELFIKER